MKNYENCNLCGEAYYTWFDGNKDSDDLKEAKEKHRCKQ